MEQWCHTVVSTYSIHIDNSSCWHFIWLPTYHVDKMSDWQFITQIHVTATMDQIHLITHISQSASLINDEGGNLNKNLYNRNSRGSVLDASILSCYTSILQFNPPASSRIGCIIVKFHFGSSHVSSVTSYSVRNTSQSLHKVDIIGIHWMPDSRYRIPQIQPLTLC